MRNVCRIVCAVGLVFIVAATAPVLAQGNGESFIASMPAVAAVSGGPMQAVGDVIFGGPALTANILSFDFNMTVAGVAAGSPGATGKPVFDLVSITKVVDGSSPQLFTSAVTGRHLQSAVVRLCKPDCSSSSNVYARYTFSDIRIRKYEDGNQASFDNIQVENIAFDFRRVKIEAGRDVVCWDVAQNKTC